MRRVCILGGLRTPIGKTGGILKSLLPEDMVAVLLRALASKYNIQGFDELYLGNSVGTGGNLARLSLLKSGFGFSIPATTIDFQCGSGLKAICMAYNKIKAHEADIIIAGGVESTSLKPKRQYHRNDPRFKGEDSFYEMAQFAPEDWGNPDMISGAENTASLLNLSREEMDDWAYRSHILASKADAEGVFSDIILPLKIDEKEIVKDESIRSYINSSVLGRVKPITQGGTITCGNACLTHDGAALVVLVAEDKIKEFNTGQYIRISHESTVGVDPNYPLLGAVEAVRRLLEISRTNAENIGAFEINEAFAAKALAFIKKLNIKAEKLNKYGGALAYGHPYGASGTVIVLHLIEIMKREKLQYGIAGVGVAGGQGIAALFESSGDSIADT